MRYAIEIVRDVDGASEVLHRAEVQTITPLGARLKARAMFALWKRRRANGFRISNRDGDQVYSWRE